MKVLLLKEIPKLGHKGEVKDVSDGYAKNALIPKGLVKIATSDIIKQNEEKIKKEKELTDRKKGEVLKLLTELEENIFEFKPKIGSGGEIFNSLHQEEISKKVSKFMKERSGGLFDEKELNLETKPIKEIGEKVIVAKIGRGDYIKKTNIKINIIAE